MAITNARRLSVVFAALVAAFAFAQLPAAQAQTQTANCGTDLVCETFAPTKVTSTITKGTSQTTTTTSTSTTTSSRTRTREYERRHRVIVSIHQRPGGVKSRRGCIDPVRRGWIRPGETFSNTRKNGSRFNDRWQRGDRIKNPTRKRVGGRHVMQGDKCDCDNEKIRIRVHGPKFKPQTRRVLEFESYREFEKFLSSRTDSSSTSQGPTVFTVCPAGYEDHGATCVLVTYRCPEGSELVGNMCKRCVPKDKACPPPVKPVCRYLANPAHVFPGMTRPIDLECTRAFQVEIGRDWTGSVVFHERTPNPDGTVKWRFMYTAPRTWVATFDDGTFTPIASDGTPGDSVYVRVETPPDDFGPGMRRQ